MILEKKLDPAKYPQIPGGGLVFSHMGGGSSPQAKILRFWTSEMFDSLNKIVFLVSKNLKNFRLRRAIFMLDSFTTFDLGRKKCGIFRLRRAMDRFVNSISAF